MLKYDLTDFIQDGENVIEIQLAPGWYRQNERVAEGRMSFGKKLKALFAAEFIISYSNLYIGEVHDARLLDVEQEPQPVEVLVGQEYVLAAGENMFAVVAK